MPGNPAEILSTLKSETTEWHARIEDFVPVFREGFSLVDYRRLLERFYGFYSQFEPAVEGVAGLTRILPDLAERRKTVWLEADLARLGVAKEDLPGLPVCTLLPSLDSLATAFGALYVTEGSTLGGVVICRHIERSLGVTPEDGARFFGGHAGNTSAKWKTFTQALTGMTTAHNKRVIVQSAVDTFRTLCNWLSEVSKEPATGRDQSGQNDFSDASRPKPPCPEACGHDA